MNLNRTSLLLLIVITLLGACTSGKQAMERGDYYQSVMLSVNRLQRSPDHKKSAVTLRTSYPLAIDYYDENVRNLKARNDINKWRGIVDSYSRVNEMYEAIRRSPGALKVVPNPKNYYNELAEAKQNAAEESYRFGIAELNKRTVQSGRNAFIAFRDADAYVPGYKDVNSKMEEAYWMGTTKVLINPIPVTSARVQLSAQFFEDKIHEYVKTQPINEFTRFMTQADLDQLGLSPDHVLQMQFDEFTIGEVRVVERQVDQSKDNVVVGSVNASSLVSSGGSRPTGTTGSNTTVNNTNTNTSNTTVNNTNTNNTTVNNTSNTNNTTVNNSNTSNTTTNNTTVNNTSNNTTVNNTTNNSTSTTVNNNTSSGNTSSTGSTTGGSTGTTTGGSTGTTTGGSTGTTTGGSTGTTTGGSTGTTTGGSTGTTTGGSTGTTTGGSTGTTTGGSTGTTTGGSTGTTTGGSTTSSGKMISVCHESNVISINESALPAHLGHGDKIFNCNSSASTKVRICHKTGSGTQTLEVAVSALKAHLDHGDVLGGCDGSSPQVEDKSNGKGKEPFDGQAFRLEKHDNTTLFASASANESVLSSFIEPSSVVLDTNINVTATVKAKVFIFEKTVRSYGTLDFKILDANTGSLISAEKFSGEYVWKSQWGYFNGDERALTDEQRAIVNQREAIPPGDQDMFIFFTQPIFDQLVLKLRRFYN